MLKLDLDWNSISLSVSLCLIGFFPTGVGPLPPPPPPAAAILNYYFLLLLALCACLMSLFGSLTLCICMIQSTSPEKRNMVQQKPSKPLACLPAPFQLKHTSSSSSSLFCAAGLSCCRGHITQPNMSHMPTMAQTVHSQQPLPWSLCTFHFTAGQLWGLSHCHCRHTI